MALLGTCPNISHNFGVKRQQLKLCNEILPGMSDVQYELNRRARFRDIGIFSERGQTDRRTDGRTDPAIAYSAVVLVRRH